MLQNHSTRFENHVPGSIGPTLQFLPLERGYVINWSGLFGNLFLKSNTCRYPDPTTINTFTLEIMYKLNEYPTSSSIYTYNWTLMHSRGLRSNKSTCMTFSLVLNVDFNETTTNIKWQVSQWYGTVCSKYKHHFRHNNQHKWDDICASSKQEGTLSFCFGTVISRLSMHFEPELLAHT